jgi:hypothetical protein
VAITSTHIPEAVVVALGALVEMQVRLSEERAVVVVRSILRVHRSITPVEAAVETTPTVLEWVSMVVEMEEDEAARVEGMMVLRIPAVEVEPMEIKAALIFLAMAVLVSLSSATNEK